MHFMKSFCDPALSLFRRKKHVGTRKGSVIFFFDMIRYECPPSLSRAFRHWEGAGGCVQMAQVTNLHQYIARVVTQLSGVTSTRVRPKGTNCKLTPVLSIVNWLAERVPPTQANSDTYKRLQLVC